MQLCESMSHINATRHGLHHLPQAQGGAELPEFAFCFWGGWHLLKIFYPNGNFWNERMWVI